MSTPTPVFVAVDGPSASGKTTLAQAVARRTGLPFLDTGLMFRPAANLCRGGGGPSALADHAGVDLVHGRSQRTLWRGVDTTETLWAEDGGDFLGRVSRDPQWRGVILGIHLQLVAAHPDGLIAVGRDVSQTLLPDADLRVYLTADQDVRQKRRTRQWGRFGTVGPPTELDRSTRALLRARGGLDIDTTALSIADVLASVTTELDALYASRGRTDPTPVR
jgi:CMP/dCMP kinase